MTVRFKYWHIKEIRMARARKKDASAPRASFSGDRHKRLRMRYVTRWNAPGGNSLNF